MKIRRKTSDEITGFLDQGADVTGELQFSGTLRLDGNFHGSITTSDILVVGENAVLHADVKAGEVEIHGHVLGTIAVSRRVEIHPTGQVHGDIQAPTLIIHAGAVFEGRSSMSAKNDGSSGPHPDVGAFVEKGTDETH